MKNLKLAVIDLSYQLHRALRVDELSKLRDSNGRPTGGVYGVAKILSTIMQEYPNHLPVFVSDKGLCKRRLEVFPNYKHCADRKVANAVPELELTTEELEERRKSEEYRDMYRSSKEYIKDLSNRIGIPHIEIDGYEGDDLAAIIVQSSKVSDIVLVSDDNDWRGMLDLRKDIKVELFRAMKKEKITSEQFLEGGNNIERFTLIKSAVGDSSDNIPNLVKGVGESFATKFFDCLLEEFSYRDIVEWDSETAGKMRARLLGNFSGKKVGDFLNAMDTTRTMKQNTDLIDLRLIDSETFEVTMEEFHKEMQRVKEKKVGLFELIGAFGSYQVTNLDVTGLHNCLLRLKEHLG